MTGEAHWFPVAAVLVGAIAILVLGWVLVRLVGRGLEDREQKLICPMSNREANLVLTYDLRKNRWSGVQACSELAFPECGHPCTTRMIAGDARKRDSGDGRRGWSGFGA